MLYKVNLYRGVGIAENITEIPGPLFMPRFFCETISCTKFLNTTVVSHMTVKSVLLKYTGTGIYTCSAAHL